MPCRPRSLVPFHGRVSSSHTAGRGVTPHPERAADQPHPQLVGVPAVGGGRGPVPSWSRSRLVRMPSARMVDFRAPYALGSIDCQDKQRAAYTFVFIFATFNSLISEK